MHAPTLTFGTYCKSNVLTFFHKQEATARYGTRQKLFHNEKLILTWNTALYHDSIGWEDLYSACSYSPHWKRTYTHLQCVLRRTQVIGLPEITTCWSAIWYNSSMFIYFTDYWITCNSIKHFVGAKIFFKSASLRLIPGTLPTRCRACQRKIILRTIATSNAISLIGFQDVVKTQIRGM